MVVEKVMKRPFCFCLSSQNVKKLKKIFNTLQSIETWLGHRVKIGCDIATPKEVSIGDQLHHMGRGEIKSLEGMNMQLHRQIPQPQCNISCPSIASHLVGKMPKLSTYSGDY